MKYLRLRDFRLMILVPAVSLTLVVLLAAVNRSNRYMQEQRQQALTALIEGRGEGINQFLEHSTGELELTAHYVAQMQAVRESFYGFELYKNPTEAGDLLNDEIKALRRNSPREISTDRARSTVALLAPVACIASSVVSQRPSACAASIRLMTCCC